MEMHLKLLWNRESGKEIILQWLLKVKFAKRNIKILIKHGGFYEWNPGNFWRKNN